MKSKFDRLLGKARTESPFGLPRDYGFETSLRSAIRSAGSEVRAIDVFSRFCWRFSMLCLPVSVSALVVVTMFSHLQIPQGTSGFVSFCTDLISSQSLSSF